MALIDFSDVPDSSELPKGEYNYKIISVSQRTDDLERVESIDIEGVAEHEGQKREVRDIFRFKNAYSGSRDLKRARKLAQRFNLIDAKGQADLSEEALIGKELRAYIQFDSFHDTNCVRRYVKASTAISGVLL